MKHYKYQKAISFLNDQYWHDSVLYEIRINRENSADKVEVTLDLITSKDGNSSNRCNIAFNDCYYIGTKMFGGVDTISDGEMISQTAASVDSADIDNVVDSWKSIIELTELFLFSMTLSSTDSQIEIVCKSISFENVENGGTAFHVIPKIE